MELTVSGFDLFIAETAALSLIGDVEVGGNMSSAFQKRHKIREADVLSRLTECAATPAGSYARLLGIAYLLSNASAAYAEVGALMQSESLKTCMVTHHFGGGTRTLEKACVSEPMNLWFGWALENTRNNTVTFDPHVVGHLKSKAGLLKTSLPSNMLRDGAPMAQTPGQQALTSMGASNILLQGAQHIEHEPSTRPRSLTPTSAGLQKMLKHNDNYLQGIKNNTPVMRMYDHRMAGDETLLNNLKLACQHIDTHYQFPLNYEALLRDLERNMQSLRSSLYYMYKLVEDMNRRGKQHYQTLREQLKLRTQDGMPNMVQSMLSAINAASNGWDTNRAVLLQTLVDAINSIDGQSPVPVLRRLAPDNGFMINPDFYMLLR